METRNFHLLSISLLTFILPLCYGCTNNQSVSLHQQVNRAILNENYDLAVQLATQLVEQDAKDGAAQVLKGRAYLAHGQLEEARLAFTKAIEINPEDFDALHRRAEVYRQLRDNANYLADKNQARQYDTTYQPSLASEIPSQSVRVKSAQTSQTTDWKLIKRLNSNEHEEVEEADEQPVLNPFALESKSPKVELKPTPVENTSWSNVGVPSLTGSGTDTDNLSPKSKLLPSGNPSLLGKPLPLPALALPNINQINDNDELGDVSQAPKDQVPARERPAPHRLRAGLENPFLPPQPYVQPNSFLPQLAGQASLPTTGIQSNPLGTMAQRSSSDASNMNQYGMGNPASGLGGAPRSGIALGSLTPQTALPGQALVVSGSSSTSPRQAMRHNVPKQRPREFQHLRSGNWYGYGRQSVGSPNPTGFMPLVRPASSAEGFSSPVFPTP